MENNSDHSYMRGFLFGAIIGGAVGAVTALLLAPKSGEELRDDIARRSGEIYGKATDYISTAKDEADKVINQGKTQADRIVMSARTQAENLMHNAEQMIQDAKFRASNAKEQVGENINRVRDAAKAGAEAFKTEIKSTKDVDTELG